MGTFDKLLSLMLGGLLVLVVMVLVVAGFARAARAAGDPTPPGLVQCGRDLVTELGGEDTAAVQDIVSAVSDKSPDLVAALLVIGALESRLTRHPAKGLAGEIGTFQILPSTIEWLQPQCSEWGDPVKLRTNTRLAACYLEHLLGEADGDLTAAVAAYNAGPSAITKYRNYRPLPGTTANYVVRFNKLKRGTTCSKYSAE